MALMRWEPFREIETIRRQMDQLFSELKSIAVTQMFSITQTAWVPAVELKTLVLSYS